MKTVRIGGITAEVVSDAQAEEAAFVVCGDAGLPYPFVNNVETTCCDCGRAVVHRPYAPRRPKKICLECITLRSQAGPGAPN